MLGTISPGRLFLFSLLVPTIVGPLTLAVRMYKPENVHAWYLNGQPIDTWLVWLMIGLINFVVYSIPASILFIALRRAKSQLRNLSLIGLLFLYLFGVLAYILYKV